MKSVKSTLLKTLGLVDFRGKWIPRYYAVKLLMVCEMPEVHRELVAALYGHDTVKGK